MPDKSVELRLILSGIFLMSDFFDKCSVFLWRFSGLCQMVLMTSKTSLQKWSGVFFPSVFPVFFQIGTVPYQHRLRFRWVSIVMSTATGQSRGARDRDKVWNRALSPRAPGLLERQQASLLSESTWAERAAR